jgi:hypothetical protein
VENNVTIVLIAAMIMFFPIRSLQMQFYVSRPGRITNSDFRILEIGSLVHINLAWRHDVKRLSGRGNEFSFVKMLKLPDELE